MKRRSVIISGGGTGGHLYPALMVGQGLKQRDSQLRIIHVGSSRALEQKLMEQHQAEFFALKIEGIKGKGIKKIRTIFLLPYALLRSGLLLIRFRPQLVIGAGGYSSGPIMLLAALMRIPTLILEQNRRPGLTNRLLLPWIRKAAVAFKSSLADFKSKGVYTGNPVRKEFLHQKPKARNSRLVILIFGGSQGSHCLNQGIISILPFIKKENEELKIFHQTGEMEFEQINSKYSEFGITDAVIAPYFNNMAEYFQQADIIICRAGATTIAELIAAGKAAVLIPFAQATDDHQLENARELETIGGAEIILEAELSSEILSQKISDFKQNREKISRMEKNLQQLKTENAADKITDLCFDLMQKRT